MAIGSPQWMYKSGEAYTIDQSLKFNDDDSPYLGWTPSSAGNLNKWTWSGWVKRGNITNSSYPALFGAYISSSVRDVLRFTDTDELSLQVKTASATYTKTSNAKYRDPSAWLHIIVVWDSANATASHRLRMYVNGSEITLTGTDVASGSPNSCINNANSHFLGARSSDGNPSAYHDGFLGEVNFIDGQALTPADFGETGTYGEWKPIKYSGTYGTNGFYLPFKQDYTVEGFSTVTWKNTAPMYVGGVGFKADLVWAKSRLNAQNSAISDAITGFDRYGSTSLTNAFYSGLTSIAPTTDGFTSNTDWFTNGYSYVAWSWDMGGSNATNTNGSITSTVRANPTYGQSIVSYTGNGGSNQTVGHGLSSTPDMVILKGRDNGSTWYTGHVSLGTNEALGLNETGAVFNVATGQSGGGIGARSSTTFTLQDGTINANNVNTNNEGFIAYCWHSVTGYSKFGSYTGNGNLAGPSVTLGFKPAFVLIRKTNGGADWLIFDSTRNPTNEVRSFLEPNTSDAETIEQTTNYELGIDFDSNGFQIKARGGGMNGNGDNYIYMAFADKREYAYWLDQSGNNNDWTSNNLTESDISVDSPTNNFATLNPLIPDAYTTLSEGNLKIVHGSSFGGQFASQIIESGKWYAEYLVTTVGLTKIGIASANRNLSAADPQNWSEAFWYNQDGTQRDGSTDSSYGASYTNGDVIGVKLDQDNNTIDYSKNGVYQGSISLSGKGVGTNPTFIGTSGRDSTGIWNFGQDSSFAGNKTAQGNQDSNDIGDFYYTPPTGFLALCTKNLPDVAVTPSEHFNTVLWSGSGSSQSITGVGFQPDWLWIKMRSSAYNHRFFDAIRGSANGLYSPNTNVEGDYSAYDGVTSFDTDGFSLSGKDGTDKSGETYVAWNWKANGSGSSNTDGSVTTTVSANTDAGFSIATYTGTGSSATFGHGLSKAPEISFYKIRSQGYQWMVYTGNVASTTTLVLNGTDTGYNSGGTWGTHGASTFALLSNADVNGSGQTYVSYHFHSVDGYSKVGSYTGNGSTDGTFVYTGFRPMLIITKSTQRAEHWRMRDTVRDTDNPLNTHLEASTSGAEQTSAGVDIDILSNGFKLRSSDSGVNANGEKWIYIAFAETPFKNSNAR